MCQIFYELKGGRVKYGKGHAARFGHEPEGETFHPGSFPEVGWGMGIERVEHIHCAFHSTNRTNPKTFNSGTPTTLCT